MSFYGKPALFRLHHCYEPHDGLETLYFYKAFDPEVDPSTDPNVVKLIGPTSTAECMSAVRCIKIVLLNFVIEIDEENGADD